MTLERSAGGIQGECCKETDYQQVNTMKTENEIPQRSEGALAAEHDERRQWSRIPCEGGDQWRISSAGQLAQRVDLEDVSFGGIALSARIMPCISSGEEICVHYATGLFSAVVRYVMEEEDGTYRIGCRWVEPESPNIRALVRDCLEA